jgi:hypothetical protein
VYVQVALLIKSINENIQVISNRQGEDISYLAALSGHCFYFKRTSQKRVLKNVYFHIFLTLSLLFIVVSSYLLDNFQENMIFKKGTSLAVIDYENNIGGLGTE